MQQEDTARRLEPNAMDTPLSSELPMAIASKLWILFAGNLFW